MSNKYLIYNKYLINKVKFNGDCLRQDSLFIKM